MNKLTKAIVGSAFFLTLQHSALAVQEDVTRKSESDKISRLENIIEKLEERVSRLEKRAISTSMSSQPDEKIDPRFGWKYKQSWLKLKEGMSAAQVESILGHPTRVDDMGKGFKKLFYWGELPSGSISGYIEIYGNSVYKIYHPEFHE